MASKTSISTNVAVENNTGNRCSFCCTNIDVTKCSCGHTCGLLCLELSQQKSDMTDNANSSSCKNGLLSQESSIHSSLNSGVTDIASDSNNPLPSCIMCKRINNETHLSTGKQLCKDSDALGQNGIKHQQMRLPEPSEELGSLSRTLVCHCLLDDGVDSFGLNCRVAASIGDSPKLCGSQELCDSGTIPYEFQQHSETTYDSLLVSADRCRSMLHSVCDIKNNVSNQIARADVEICSAADRLKDYVEQCKQQALETLAKCKQTRMRQIDSLQDGLNKTLSLIENCRRCSQQIEAGGKIEDGVYTTNPIPDQTDVLSALDVLQVRVNCAGSINVSFIASAEDFGNVIGKISDTSTTDDGAEISSEPRLLHVIPRGLAVVGVTLVADQLFVLRWPSQQQLEIYNAETFVFNRPLAVPGLSGRPGGLTSCSTNKYLYVSDFKNSILHRIGLSNDHKPSYSHWSVDRQPTGLSVNADCNVLVTCRGSPLKVQEFTPEGLLVREICLPLDLTRPMHTVQLNGGQLLTANGGTLPGQFGSRASDLHRVCLLDTGGSIVSSYGNVCGSGTGQLDEPMHLAVTSSGVIIAADKENHRLFVLNSSLTLVHELHLTVAGGLKGPISLYFDEPKGRLFVGEGIGGRLLIFGNVANIGDGLF